ncbi:hypothetical protein [Streptomyces griseorubiginosus]|uniref:hypothetical protein n=1 Tax=Streptomyces griseorubiginosus TaxID=67304 RepID=UPI0035CCD37A
MRIATGGLPGGLLVGLGLSTRPATDPITLFDGPWPVLAPLTVPAGGDLLRRGPRTALLMGTADADVATRLDMAEATVKTHVSRPPGRPELRGRVQAALPAQELGVRKRLRESYTRVVQTY